MFNFDCLYRDLEKNEFSDWSNSLPERIASVFSSRYHGKQPQWLEILKALPDIHASTLNLDSGCLQIGKSSNCDSATKTQLTSLLKQLCPWRKGPYELFGIHIDSEWRSDLKWDRIVPHTSQLKNRAVLDVGCGNGYHMWRMFAEGARLVIGTDPSQLFLTQFHAIKHYTGELPVHQLPFKSEELPAFSVMFKGNGFDTVFSMGVLYHRPSPINHLKELKSFLRTGGELVLETLILEGDGNELLIPKARYAKMRNVWFIPTTAILLRMLQRVGFINIQVVDINRTTIEEQRSTDWMNYESLPDFLDPVDSHKTVEGYSSPLRAVIVCNTS